MEVFKLGKYFLKIQWTAFLIFAIAAAGCGYPRVMSQRPKVPDTASSEHKNFGHKFALPDIFR